MICCSNYQDKLNRKSLAVKFLWKHFMSYKYQNLYSERIGGLRGETLHLQSTRLELGRMYHYAINFKIFPGSATFFYGDDVIKL